MQITALWTLSALAALVAGQQQVSTSARCGPDYGGLTCQGSRFGNCCSQYSYCGSTNAYCKVGCQSGYGTCSGVAKSSSSSSSSFSSSSSSTRSSSTSSMSTRTASSATPSSTAKVSTNARCGKGFGFTCLGSKYGNCCSQYSYCGSGDSYCGTGCQDGFGTCNPVAHSSGSSSASSSRSSSAVSSSTAASTTRSSVTSSSTAAATSSSSSSATSSSTGSSSTSSTASSSLPTISSTSTTPSSSSSSSSSAAATSSTPANIASNFCLKVISPSTYVGYYITNGGDGQSLNVETGTSPRYPPAFFNIPASTGYLQTVSGLITATDDNTSDVVGLFTYTAAEIAASPVQHLKPVCQVAANILQCAALGNPYNYVSFAKYGDTDDILLRFSDGTETSLFPLLTLQLNYGSDCPSFSA